MAGADRPGQSRPVARIGTLVVIAVIALVLLGLTLSAWRSISPGYVGIVFDKANHNVTASALEPGWAFINPFCDTPPPCIQKQRTRNLPR